MTFRVEVRQDAVQPARDPPVGPRREVHRGRDDEQPNDRRVDEDADTQAERKHLDHDVGREQEREEDAGHDHCRA
jgi:hypothetical protein